MFFAISSLTRVAPIGTPPPTLGNSYNVWLQIEMLMCPYFSRSSEPCLNFINNKDTSRHFTSFLQLFHEFQAGYFYTGFPLNWFNDCCSSLTERQFFKRFCVTIFTKENRLDKWLERLPVSFICGYRKSTKCLSMITP